MEGSLIGEMDVRNGAGDFATAMKTMHIPTSSLSFFEMDGIFLCSEDGRIFMSRWTEGEPLTVDMEHFGEWRESQPEEPPVEEEVYTKEDLHKREDMHVKEDMHARETLHETEKIISETENKPAAGKMSVQDSMKSSRKTEPRSPGLHRNMTVSSLRQNFPHAISFHSTSGRTSGSSFKNHPASMPFSEKILPVLKLN